MLSCPATKMGVPELVATFLFRFVPQVLVATWGVRILSASAPPKAAQVLALCAPPLIVVAGLDLVFVLLSALGVGFSSYAWLFLLILVAYFAFWQIRASSAGRMQSQCCCATLPVFLVLAVILFRMGGAQCSDGVYEVLDSGGVTGSNFGGNTRPGENCPRSVEERTPADLDALRTLLARQEDGGVPYTLVGTRHSWSDVVQGRCLLSLANFKEITVSRDSMTVRVGAGVRFGELQEKLHAEGLTLPNYGAVNIQTVVGAVMTGTHGSGTGGVHTLLTGLYVMHVDSQGLIQSNRLSLENDTQAASEWTMSMGHLGVVLDVDLRVVESFNLEHFEDDMPAIMSIDDAPGFLECENFGGRAGCMNEMFLAPQISPSKVFGMLTRVTTEPIDTEATPPQWNRTDIPANALDSGNPWVADNYFFLSLLHGVLRTVGGFIPESIPEGRKVVDALLTLGRTEHHSVRHVEMEVFIHLDDAAKALRVLSELYEDSTLRHYHAYVYFFRRVTQDPPLPAADGEPAPTFVGSPFSDRDTMTMSVFYYGTRMNSRYRPFCEKVLAVLRSQLDHEVRVHPGKWTPEAAPADSRRAQIEATWDPLNRFDNDYFGGAGARI